MLSFGTYAGGSPAPSYVVMSWRKSGASSGIVEGGVFAPARVGDVLATSACTRRDWLPFLVRSSGYSGASSVPLLLSTRLHHRQIPRRVAHAQSLQRAIARRHFVAHARDRHGPIAPARYAGLLDAKRKPKFLGRRARTSDVRTAQEALGRRGLRSPLQRAVNESALTDVSVEVEGDTVKFDPMGHSCDHDTLNIGFKDPQVNRLLKRCQIKHLVCADARGRAVDVT